jgi:nucleoside phosphorylase
MSNKKHNLIILARTSEVEDMNFYKSLLREASPIYRKAVVIMFSVVEQLGDFIEGQSLDYEFSLLIHLGKRAMGSGENGRHIIEEIRQFRWGKKIQFEFTSRDGDSVFDGIKVHHTNTLPVESFDLSTLPTNKLRDLKQGDLEVNNEVAETKRCRFAIQTALDKSENDIFRNYMDAGELNRDTWRGTFKEEKQFPEDYRKEILLVKQKKMGMVDAAYTSSKVFHETDVNYLLLAGVCGGRRTKVKMFDLIIPAKVFDFSFGSLEDGKFMQRDLDAKFDEDLINFLQRPENVKKIKAGMLKLVDTSHADKEKYVQNVEIHFDVMACGPWVIKTDEYLETLSADKNNLIRGLEMESYSIGRLFELHHKTTGRQALVVKSVMDFTDAKKGLDMEHVDTKHIAGYMSYLCVRALLPLIEEYEKQPEK